MIYSWSGGKGSQRIEDTGPLTRARMPTVDLEIYDAANSYAPSRGCVYFRPKIDE